MASEQVDKVAAALWENMEPRAGAPHAPFAEVARVQLCRGLVNILRQCARRALDTATHVVYPESDGDEIAAYLLSGGAWPLRATPAVDVVPAGEVGEVLVAAQTSGLSVLALALAEERERCAKIAETCEIPIDTARSREWIARAIRARTEP